MQIPSMKNSTRARAGSSSAYTASFQRIVPNGGHPIGTMTEDSVPSPLVVVTARFPSVAPRSEDPQIQSEPVVRFGATTERRTERRTRTPSRWGAMLSLRRGSGRDHLRTW